MSGETWSPHPILPPRAALPAGVSAMTASLLLLLLAPSLLLCSLIVRIGSPGPLLVRRPVATRDGRVIYPLAFRTQRSARSDDGGAAAPVQGWAGRMLAVTGLAAVPALADVAAGRIGLRDACGI